LAQASEFSTHSHSKLQKTSTMSVFSHLCLKGCHPNHDMGNKLRHGLGCWHSKHKTVQCSKR